MPRQILLVDDSVTIHRVVEITFAREEYVLTMAKSVDEGLARARELRPDIVLADAGLPGKSGYDLCSALRADGQLGGTPCLLLTGNFAPYDEQKGTACGADGWVVKPFETQVLIDKVTEAIAKRAGHSAAAPPSPSAPAPSASPSPPASRAAPFPPAPTPIPAPTVTAPRSIPPRQTMIGVAPLAPPLSMKEPDGARSGMAPPPRSIPMTVPRLAVTAPAPAGAPTPPATTTPPAPAPRPVVAAPPAPAPRPVVAAPPAPTPPPVTTPPPAPTPRPVVAAPPALAPLPVVAPPAPAPQPIIAASLAPSVPSPSAVAQPSAAPSMVNALPANVPQMPRPSLIPHLPAPSPQVSLAPQASSARPNPRATLMGIPAASAAGLPPGTIPLPPKPATPWAPPVQQKPEVISPNAALSTPAMSEAEAPVAQVRDAPLPLMAAVTDRATQAVADAASARGADYEAIAQLSKEVIEKIVWEVVPELAETLIKEQLDRLVRERQSL